MTKSNPNVEAFVKLGEFLRLFCDFTANGQIAETTQSTWVNKFNEVTDSARHHNVWFTRENVLFAFKQWGIILTRENLETWLASYDLKKNKTKQVALIMAGNIPLVGFHDFLSVLITGNKAIIKLSSNDTLLIPLIAKYLIDTEPSFKDSITFTEGRLTDFDAVIATGSNNTARYFEYYFGKKPNIIRKNRNSVAVLNGNETNAQLEALGEDIFRYYGLGCRSVSKLFVPKDYDFDKFFKAMFRYRDIVNQTKYANNYDYNKAVYLMSEFKILDNGFLLLKEDKSHASPIASVFYETYDSKATVKERLQKNAEAIQCVVASGFTIAEIPFGRTQSPSLSDYADGIDTVEFLLKTS
jgi:hypothetical protein